MRGRTVVVVGQAVVSGAKLLGAIASLKDRGAAKVVAAAPAGTESATWQLHEAASMVVMPHRPAKFKGVESLYEDYSDVTDEIVLMIAQRWSAARPMDATQTPAPSPSESPSGKAPLTAHFKNSRGQSLACELDLPPGMMRGSGPYPAVVFAHGSESSAQSPRNLAIGAGLAQRGVIGVRMDFTGHGRSEGSSADASEFHLLTDLHVIFTHVAGLAEVDRDRLGLVGSGTGGLIALHYAAQQPMVKALVIRGPVCGRETVVARQVKSPTLLIHAEQDTAFLDAVQTLDRELASPHKLLRIPNATRLFDDPISREAMVNATVDWLVDHLKLPTTGHGVESRLEIETTSRMDMPLSAT